MSEQKNGNLLQMINRTAVPIIDQSEKAFDALIDQIGDASVVLIGEASHGTHQFYRTRADLTRLLLERKGFNAVAVEADWPDAYRANRYVQHRSSDRSADEALGDFKRFPQWMWRNTEVVDFVNWLHQFNERRSESERAGFFGLDLYSLYTSIEAVIQYLDEVDPEAAQKARYRYSCFEQFNQDPQEYGYAATYGVTEGCEEEVVEQLTELRHQALNTMRQDGFVAQDEQFYAEQNARLVRNAERYYREMFRGRNSSWNLRDRHMYETLTALMGHLRKQQRDPRVVVWAHNSHLGDARYTEMSTRGELNLGQLVKEHFGKSSHSVGFTTYTGTVAAASNWGESVERKDVRPAIDGSYERLFHQAEAPAFALDLKAPSVSQPLQEALLERAIGVIYRPQTERISHYFYAQLSQQFDSVIHFDHSDALVPQEKTPAWDNVDLPETYPMGI